ncbi:MAG: hypothetical protein IT260_01170 [Saprospiraceae bacterium]|nr:hypothetical protein [Saprospiraceae bacterium]
MMRHVILLPLLVVIVALSSCSVQQVDPTADIPTLSFQKDISPIVSANCALSGCHDGTGEEPALLSFDDVMSYGEVTPGKPHDSKLYEVIRLYSGEEAMPPAPNQPLTDQQIGAIYVWILQGAHNN